MGNVVDEYGGGQGDEMGGEVRTREKSSAFSDFKSSFGGGDKAAVSRFDDDDGDFVQRPQ